MQERQRLVFGPFRLDQRDERLWRGPEVIHVHPKATGTEHNQPQYRALLAAVYSRAGQAEAGLTTMAPALAVVETTGERIFEAELYRLRGELLLQRGAADAQQVEAYLHHALTVARQQQAKSLELRAALSLSRLWQQQGKQAEAHQVLSEVYNWFTEGFDTADLQEAKALLEELGRGSTHQMTTAPSTKAPPMTPFSIGPRRCTQS